MNDLRATLLIGIVMIMCVAYGCSGGGKSVPPKAGSFGYLSDQDYTAPLVPISSGAKDGWVAQWEAYNWTQGFSKIDPSATDFKNHSWVDVMLLSAHGDWKPTIGMIPDNWTMQPITNERWLYIFACDSLSPIRDVNDQLILDSNMNPIPNSAWNTAFGYALHGVYGYWDEFTGNYNSDYSLAAAVAQNSWTTNTGAYPTAYTAYSNANVDQLLPWAVIDGTNSHGDSLSAVPDSYVVSGDSIGAIGQLQLWQGLEQVFHVYPIPSLSPGGQAQSQILIPETINENYWISLYQDQSTTVVHQPGVTIVYQVGGAAIHYQNSGGMKYETDASGTARGVTPTTALTEANTFIQHNGGLPKDATLRMEAADVVTPLNDSSPPTVIAYDIEYGHNSAIAGYDGIKVKVDDAGYNLCTEWGWRRDPDPPFTRYRYCMKYTWQPSPHVSYYYRLWRSMGAPIGPTQTLSFTVPTSTVLAQVPGSKSVTRQGFAYYTPPMIFNSQTDQVATPVQFYEVDNRGRVDFDLSRTFLGVSGQL